MARLSCALALLSLLCGTLLSGPVAARDTSVASLNARRLEAVKRWELSARDSNVQGNARRDMAALALPKVKNITFSNPKASRAYAKILYALCVIPSHAFAEFFVDGTTLPQVNFDVVLRQMRVGWWGPLGRLLKRATFVLLISQLFFWFFPPGPEGSLDDLIFWTNGGPGCSSLEGAFQENGPFTWATGQALPTQNEWSWTNLSSVLYVEQPVGTGFSQGKPTARNENDVAAQLVGFLQQFLEIFSELKGKKFYLTGESYAGMYVPYIANFIYENTTRSTLDLDLQGIWINDPVLGWDVVQSQIPAVGFVHKYEHVFAFNQTFLAHLDSVAEACNYADYIQKHVTYPPQGLLPLPGKSTEADPGCDVWDTIFDAALLVNPALISIWPILWDVLGFPGSFFQAQVSPLYFDRADVKAAIHAPANVDWAECSNINVFPHGDGSLPPAFTVLPNVIEKSNRTVIVHGLGDFILIAEGARIVLQNMTWAGEQGFQTPIANDSFIVDGVGALGNIHTERGLTYAEISLAGHMVPQFSPVASLQIMKYLLGFRESP
ncbi:Alpha/Beta hydrolase protein [Multifurca ochricompacta]|uniref:Carboxypeptidase n=1 Tax=Multifurca ochricompacta TaxID=376703 RepID=A0AAD4QP18_9AGAM|nr:Alpha/Beta hydrolase protein [Multifurca ochricompacta]